MLQCGLGAFPIAVLHIVAHSLYKAHAFLTSGSVISISKASWVPDAKPDAHPGVLLGALAGALLLFAGTAWLWHVSLGRETGALVMGAVLVMALAHLLWSLWGQSVSPRLGGRGPSARRRGQHGLLRAARGFQNPALVAATRGRNARRKRSFGDSSCRFVWRDARAAIAIARCGRRVRGAARFTFTRATDSISTPSRTAPFKPCGPRAKTRIDDI